MTSATVQSSGSQNCTALLKPDNNLVPFSLPCTDPPDCQLFTHFKCITYVAIPRLSNRSTRNMLTNWPHSKAKTIKTTVFCFTAPCSQHPAPSPLCDESLQNHPQTEHTKRNGNFLFKSSLTTATSYCFVMLLHLIFQNCLCRAQNWEGRTKVSLVITTKRREHSPIRITLKCTTPRARCKVQTTPGRGWGGKCRLTKQKVKSGWKGNWSKPSLDKRTGLKSPPLSLSLPRPQHPRDYPSDCTCLQPAQLQDRNASS